MIGFACTGSFCTLSKAMKQMELLSREYEILPIVSPAVAFTDTRFGKASEFLLLMEAITGHRPVMTIPDAEPLGPARPLEALVIAPCTGNTLAKLANGITDTAVTMAAKAHLRCGRPLVIAFASNDGLSGNLRNIGTLLARKSVFFVPLGQDEPISKPHSLVCDFGKIPETLEAALQGRQLQPLLLKG